ncbi:hypothetical protein GT347_19315 [Xylophilus rhododendri]|uniref:Uncharacterized protein n=1 Tax=Xylophilus rhododendri TaxID=2697032 RepID=A0A857JB23_9BURK|nr:hypothetical protein [Xylophilus rhododendri]QHI99938.1 hypothetical protein GT347_19315 [Xylophilus rhododendri]
MPFAIIPAAGPVRPAPPPLPPAQPDTRRHPGMHRDLDAVARLPVPPGPDGLPLWDQPGAGAEPSRVRNRRISLRPWSPNLTPHWRIGEKTAGQWLDDFGRVLWQVRLRMQPRRGEAKRIWRRAVRLLGGPRTRAAQQFMWRARMIGRFQLGLAHFQRQALNRFARVDGEIVREQVEKFRLEALRVMAEGRYPLDPWRAGLMKTIECQIVTRTCYTKPFYWLWAKLWTAFKC